MEILELALAGRRLAIGVTHVSPGNDARSRGCRRQTPETDGVRQPSLDEDVSRRSDAGGSRRALETRAGSLLNANLQDRVIDEMRDLDAKRERHIARDGSVAGHGAAGAGGLAAVVIIAAHGMIGLLAVGLVSEIAIMMMGLRIIAAHLRVMAPLPRPGAGKAPACARYREGEHGQQNQQ